VRRRRMPEPMSEPGAGDGRKVLVVEDDRSLRALLKDALTDEGLDVGGVASAEEAMAFLAQEPVDLVLTDLRLPGADGLELLRWLRGRKSPPAVLLVTAFGTIDQAVEALKEGADDFLTKPLDLDHLAVRVARILEHRRLRQEVARYREALEGDDFHGMVGRSPPMVALFRDLAQVGRGQGPVLIQGESGVGKELAARAVHGEGTRADGPFLAVNCAGVPAALLESEFFGHVKGAFSGATRARPGLFQEASGGTLLLDEIGEMPMELQAKLLRVLQEGVVRPVGKDRPTKVDVRVVAATNQDLREAMDEGRFREDLFYRLETFRMVVPPLRERGEDLELLAARFIRRHAARLGRTPPRPGPEFLDAIRRYSFPGNVRELDNAVERAVTFAEGSTLEPHHLPARILDAEAGGARILKAGERTTEGPWGDSHEPSGSGSPGDARTGPATRGPQVSLATLFQGEELPSLRELEQRYVRLVLERTGGNKRKAAGLLGISRRTLYRRLDDGASEGE
jgi:two-component system, NtrC family, response regulator AtoC